MGKARISGIELFKIGGIEDADVVGPGDGVEAAGEILPPIAG
jgi:hypothetical protein